MRFASGIPSRQNVSIPGETTMLKRLFAAAALSAALAVPAQASTIVIVNDNTTPANIPGLTGFATTGAMMSGLQVTACFTLFGCETLSWSTTGPASGGVSGTGWGLSVDGDTFNPNVWSFDFAAGSNVGQLVSLLLDGRDAFVIFDRTDPNQGTPGSASGRDFDTAFGPVTNFIDVTYFNPTSVGAAAAVGDLFQQVLISFRPDATGGATGPRDDFLFSQDTDNDSRFQAPEPGSLALLAIAALGLGLARRRR
jgi:PEP-CTERM motif